MTPDRTLRHVVPAVAPPRVRDRLRNAPDGPVPVLHRGRHALYVDVRGWCVGVVDAAAAQVPCALRVRTADLRALAPLDPATGAAVADGVLHVGGVALTVGRLVDTGVPALPALPAHPPATGPRGQPEPPLTTAEVARLVGAGDGLTPYGDDVLCGWLALHRAAGVPTPDVDEEVRRLAGRTTLLSATLLDCALHGEVLPQLARFVAALGSPDEPARAADLTAVGHTSGAGLLHGARRALAELGARRLDAA